MATRHPRISQIFQPKRMITEDPEQLLAEVDAALAAETRIEIDDLSIRLSVDDGSLAIDGQVDNIMTKRIAANVASGVVRNEYPVRDRLRVRVPHEGELELRDEVVQSLSSESVFSDHTLIVKAGSHRETIHEGISGGGRLEIHVEASTVVLRGQVTSLSHRRFAEVLVWWTAGCERVDNFLEVIPPQEDTDNEITDVVRMVLEKDPLMHAPQLRVGTAGGVVEIQGLVASDEERRLAVLDAWYVPGVWDVVDHIDVRA
jgi:osmotically-inducible protein OsmY